jgi:hypothetical protein
MKTELRSRGYKKTDRDLRDLSKDEKGPLNGYARQAME